MQSKKSLGLSISLFVALVVASALLAGCHEVGSSVTSSPAADASKGAGKITITTSSEEARKEYWQGAICRKSFVSRIQFNTSTKHYLSIQLLHSLN